MIGEWVRKETAGGFRWVAHALVGTGITANMITALGFILSAFVGFYAAKGMHLAAGLILIFAGLLDGLDGTLARATGGQNPFGAFWDSTLDRLSETLVFLGLLLYFLSTSSELGIVLVYVAVVGSLLVSYVRARAEGLGISPRNGFMTRFERIFLITVGLLFNQVIVALAILATLSLFTVCQRIYVVWTHCHDVGNRPAVTAYGREGKR